MAKIFQRDFEYGETKTKLPQPATVNAVQNRDLFQTPNYAIDLLIPFIPKHITHIWECAAGDGKICKRLDPHYVIFGTDIRENNVITRRFNFLTEAIDLTPEYSWAIITNPPFSLKKQFYERCMKYGIPLALLIPADYSRWIIKATQDGAEKIIPARRIDYITPNILTRIHEGEVYEAWRNEQNDKEMTPSLLSMKQFHGGAWQTILNSHFQTHNYKTIDEAPQDLLYKYSSSDFHSMWLTWGFNLGRTETFVELSIKEKKENI